MGVWEVLRRDTRQGVRPGSSRSIHRLAVRLLLWLAAGRCAFPTPIGPPWGPIKTLGQLPSLGALEAPWHGWLPSRYVVPEIPRALRYLV